MKDVANTATGNLRNAQLRMVEILVEIDKLCRRHQLRYYLDFGTLLGAVRHKGFIPWDDDIDICIYEEDWDAFCEIAPQELPSWLCLQSPKTEPSAPRVGKDGFVKVIDKNSLYIQPDDVFSKDYTKGCYVDVFKSLRYPKMPHKLFWYLCRRIAYALGFLQGNRLINFKNIICYFVYPLSLCFHSLILYSFYVFGKSNLIHCCPRGYMYGHRSPYEVFFPLKEIEFEGHLFMAPNNPDQRLKDVFGDYTKLPSKDKRHTHSKFIFIDKRIGDSHYQNE